MSQPAEVRVRPMSGADLECVLKIAVGLPQAPLWPLSAYREAMDPEHRPRRIALVAADGETDAPVGFVVASLVVPQAELETIAVAPGGQRRGVGARMVEALLKALAMEEVTELILEVRASNLAAFKFYRALGFMETGRRPRYYADPEEDAVLMGLKLG